MFDNLVSLFVDQAIDMLRVIQLNTLEDRSVHDKQEWDQAVKFFESSVKDKLAHTEQTLEEMMGPSTTQKWLHWTNSTEDQNKRKWVKSELDKIIQSDSVGDFWLSVFVGVEFHEKKYKNFQKHPPALSYDELTTVRKNLQRSNIEVETDYIRETWYPIYRRYETFDLPISIFKFCPFPSSDTSSNNRC